MICKIWGIKPQKRDITQGFTDCLAYITDREKTAGDPLKDLSMPDLKDDITPALEYIADEHKTKTVYVSGYMCNPDLAKDEFYLTKQINLDRIGKSIEDDTGNQAYHIVQSFPDDLDISDEEVHQCGIDLVKKLEKYQAIIASHVNPVIDEEGELHGKAKHNHIIINSHMNPQFVDPKNPDLMKYHNCKETFSILQQFNDEVAIEHGLPIIEDDLSKYSYTWYETREANEGRSWKQKVKDDIREAKNSTSSWDEYLIFMKKLGYQIHEGKHQTYTTPHGQKVRGSTLGREYTKEYIESYWNFRRNLQNQVAFELKKNEGTVSAERLTTLLKDENTRYFFKIPRTNAATGQKYSMFYPLSNIQDEKVVRTYFHDDAVYPLYRGKEEVIGAVNGDIAYAVLTGKEYITYEEQKKFETEENEKVLEGDIQKVLEEEKRNVYQIREWKNSSTGKPYSIGMYDDDGNRRSLLEQILMLAIMVISHETPEFLLTEREKQPFSGTVIIIDELPEKAKGIFEALENVREEGITTASELNERLNQTGIEIAKLNRRVSESHKVRTKMDRLNMYVEGYEAEIRDSSDETDGNMVDNMAGKIIDTVSGTVLLRYGIKTYEELENFKSRYKECIARDNNLTIELHNLNERYRKLKKIAYHLEKAQDRNYCYGLEKEPARGLE